MEDEKSSNRNSGPSPTNIALGLASIAAGAYHGWCDSQGIEFENENTEALLKYGPAIVQSGLGVVGGGLGGLVFGAAYNIGNNTDSWDKKSEMVKKGLIGAPIGAIIGASVGGAIGGIKGGLQTLLGYGIGYAAGYVLAK